MLETWEQPSTDLPAGLKAAAEPVVQPRGSMFRRFSRSLRTYRLGDLMVASGVLRAEDLVTALALQKQSRDPLGRILVREGYVSAAQLYTKLAEQWCMKASTAGVAFMLQTFTPSVARADDSALRKYVWRLPSRRLLSSLSCRISASRNCLAPWKFARMICLPSPNGQRS